MTEGMDDAVLARLRVISVLLTLGLAVVGCGGGDPVAQPTTTLTQEARDEAELTQLAEDWHRAVRAVARGEADISEIDDLAVDPLLSQRRDGIAGRPKGETSVADPRSMTTVLGVDVNGDVASILQCVIDADRLVDATGEVINDDVIGLRNRLTALRTNDGWRLSRVETLARENGRCPE